MGEGVRKPKKDQHSAETAYDTLNAHGSLFLLYHDTIEDINTDGRRKAVRGEERGEIKGKFMTIKLQ